MEHASPSCLEPETEARPRSSRAPIPSSAVHPGFHSSQMFPFPADPFHSIHPARRSIHSFHLPSIPCSIFRPCHLISPLATATLSFHSSELTSRWASMFDPLFQTIAHTARSTVMPHTNSLHITVRQQQVSGFHSTASKPGPPAAGGRRNRNIQNEISAGTSIASTSSHRSATDRNISRRRQMHTPGIVEAEIARAREVEQGRLVVGTEDLIVRPLVVTVRRVHCRLPQLKWKGAPIRP